MESDFNKKLKDNVKDAPIATVLIDTDGKIVFANTLFVNLFRLEYDPITIDLNSLLSEFNPDLSLKISHGKQQISISLNSKKITLSCFFIPVNTGKTVNNYIVQFFTLDSYSFFNKDEKKKHDQGQVNPVFLSKSLLQRLKLDKIEIFLKKGQNSASHYYLSSENEGTLPDIAFSLLNPLIQQFTNEKNVYYSRKDKNNIPEILQNEFSGDEIKSCLCIPYYNKDDLVAIVSFVSVNSKFNWDVRDIDDWTVIAQLLVKSVSNIKSFTVPSDGTLENNNIIEHYYSGSAILLNDIIVSINNAALELIGADNREQILGHSVYEILGPEYIEIAKNYSRQLMSNDGITEGYEFRLIKLDGTLLDIECIGIKVEYNRQPALRIVFRDITRQKNIQEKLKESENRYRTLAEAAHDMIFIVDRDGSIVYVNSFAAEQFDKTADEMVQYNTSDFFPVEDGYTQTKLLSHAIETEQAFYIELKTTLPKSELWLGTWLVPLHNKDGKVDQVLGVSRDITPIKNVEQQLIQSKEKYQLLVDNQTDMVVKVDTENYFIYASPSYCEMFGKSEQELVGKSFLPYVHKSDRSPTQEKMKDLFHPPYECYVEQRARTQKGWRWIGWADKAIVDESGNITEIIGVGRDITEQKLAELALRESEEKYKSLFLTAKDAIIIMNGKKILDANVSCREMLMVDNENLYSKMLWDFSPPTQNNSINSKLFMQEKIKSAIRGKDQTFDYILENERGLIYTEIKLCRFKLNGRWAVISIIRDISERQQSERLLYEKIGRFRDIVERSLDGYYFLDTDGSLEYLNKAAEKMIGIEKEHLRDFLIKKISEKDIEKSKKYFSQVMGGRPITWQEIELVNSNNNRFWIGFNARRVIENGIVIGVEGFVKDVTKQKLAERASRKNEARYRALFNSIPFEVFGLSIDGLFSEANDTFIEHWGKVLGKNPKEVLADATFSQIISSMVNESTIHHVTAIRDWSKDAKEQQRFYKSLLSPIATEDKQLIGFVGLNIDVTDLTNAIQENKKFSARLVDIQEDERAKISREIHDSLGQYLTALEFEIKAALSALSNNTDFAKKILQDTRNTIEKAILEAQDLCHLLRPPLLDDYGLIVALKDYFDEYTKMSQIKIEFEYNEKSDRLTKNAETTLFRVSQEALTNILKHAQATLIRIYLKNQIDGVELVINDNGSGFDPDVFNNSQRDQFGLIGMRERVEFLQGSFIIKSEPKKGSEIRAFIPYD